MKKTFSMWCSVFVVLTLIVPAPLSAFANQAILNKPIRELQQENKAKKQELRQEIRSDKQELRQEFRRDKQELRQDFKQKRQDIRVRYQEKQQDLKKDILVLRKQKRMGLVDLIINARIDCLKTHADDPVAARQCLRETVKQGVLDFVLAMRDARSACEPDEDEEALDIQSRQACAYEAFHEIVADESSETQADADVEDSTDDAEEAEDDATDSSDDADDDTNTDDGDDADADEEDTDDTETDTDAGDEV